MGHLKVFMGLKNNLQIKFLFYLYRKEKFNQNHKEAVIERHSEKWRSWILEKNEENFFGEDWRNQ